MIETLTRLLEQFPGSFTLGGRRSEDIISGWAVESNGMSRAFTEPATGFRVDVMSTAFAPGGGLELSTQFCNSGSKRAPSLGSVRVLDLALPTGDVVPTLTNVTGSTCGLTDFLPVTHRLVAGASGSFEPVGGRSSNGIAPFFALDTGPIQLAILIGWSGQWVAEYKLSASALNFSVGLKDANLCLLAGEVITAPSVLICATSEGVDHAIGSARAILRDHYLPQGRDGAAVTPTAHMTMHAFHATRVANETIELATIERAASLGIEAHWVDACWYGNDSDWIAEAGNWFVRQQDFPNGLGVIGDAAHRNDMQFVLWVEPERAQPSSRLAIEHPEFFIAGLAEHDALLLNLGHEDANEYLCDLLSSLIDQAHVDIYRQDFNVNPLQAWRKHDALDRKGMTEIRHIEGLYRLWDELRRRFPALVIDNCASGGRRIDLETLRRSVSLWRSDYGDFGMASDADRDLGNQIHISGLSRWVWQHSGPLTSFEPYSARSALATSTVFYRDLPVDEPTMNLARGAVLELKRLRNYWRGDYYELVPLSVDEGEWWAYQLHEAGSESGFALFFRRRAAQDETRVVALRAIDEGQLYSLRTSYDFNRGEPRTVSGAELVALCVEIGTAPGSALIEYAKVDGDASGGEADA